METIEQKYQRLKQELKTETKENLILAKKYILKGLRQKTICKSHHEIGQQLTTLKGWFFVGYCSNSNKQRDFLGVNIW